MIDNNNNNNSYVQISATREGHRTAFATGVGEIAMKIHVVRPVHVAVVGDATAMKLHLDDVDQILEVRVLAVIDDQVLRQSILDKVDKRIGKEEAEHRDEHLEDKEHQQYDRVLGREKMLEYICSIAGKGWTNNLPNEGDKGSRATLQGSRRSSWRRPPGRG